VASITDSVQRNVEVLEAGRPAINQEPASVTIDVGDVADWMLDCVVDRPSLFNAVGTRGRRGRIRVGMTCLIHESLLGRDELERPSVPELVGRSPGPGAARTLPALRHRQPPEARPPRELAGRGRRLSSPT